ncbi:MAG: VWA domain-containing protein, partial [Chloroflexi bacterium]|nr:VWA domain-containing protein [Chloroflexota bacterium]
RDGVSFSHPAAFVLIGTMNPEEGDLRPQLLDRFGLAVDVDSMPSTADRAEVVRRRIAFERHPSAFAADWAVAEASEAARIAAAQRDLADVELPDAMLDLIARICTAFEVDGLRADIVTYKAAATLAAYAGRRRVTAEDVRHAAELALPHRRRRQPFDQPGLDRQKLDEVVDEFTQQEPPPDSDPPRADHDDDPPPPPSRPRAPSPSTVSLPPVPPPGAAASPRAPGDSERAAPRAQQQTIFDPAAAPDLHLPASAPTHRRADPGAPHARHRTATVSGPRGRHIRSVATPVGAVDVLASLRQATHQRDGHPGLPPNMGNGMRLRREDLRYKLRAAPVGTLTVFVVDASGSMAARRRMALAKGSVLRLLLTAYQTRQEVALIAFRGAAADVLLPPTSSVHLASSHLRELPTGGRTPLALALRKTASLLHQARQRHATGHQRLVVISDGRANVPLAPGADGFADALAAARRLRTSRAETFLIDTEDGPVRLGRAVTLAGALGACYLRLATP